MIDDPNIGALLVYGAILIALAGAVVFAAFRLKKAGAESAGTALGHTDLARDRIKDAWGNVEQAYLDNAPSKIWIRHAEVLWREIDGALATRRRP